ncbi:hypothetical protein [Bacillus coahuilensis]|nr:hypothetical protein [Bacillus coahuilensis]
MKELVIVESEGYEMLSFLLLIQIKMDKRKDRKPLACSLHH